MRLDPEKEELVLSNDETQIVLAYSDHQIIIGLLQHQLERNKGEIRRELEGLEGSPESVVHGSRPRLNECRIARSYIPSLLGPFTLAKLNHRPAAYEAELEEMEERGRRGEKEAFIINTASNAWRDLIEISRSS